MTLLTTVGFPYKPSIAGSGGLYLTSPLFPSKLSSNDVSSPQIYAPAALVTSNLKENSLSKIFLPKNPFFSAILIASLRIA